MPLRLKSLELHGFKTFAGGADFVFAEGITAIVGPNGSGKSNIADALRWVLGEQSYSILRAKKTEDMIFAGSEQRPRAGMASVTVVFDNSDNWLPVDFSEVAVARRAYRDGHNEYLLNGQLVRLKDIYELLAQSGLSERTYTILGQGLVDASLALKADERRRLFEEAAGVGLYRARREEALRRLEATHRNLERSHDILAELEPRLKSLERQAKRAQEFAQVQADLRVLLRDWYGFHWHQSQRELGEARETAHGYDAKLHEAREAYQAIRNHVAMSRDRLQGLRARLNSWHRESSQIHEERGTIGRDLAVRDERVRTLIDNRQAIVSEQNRLASELENAANRLAEAEAETKRLKQEHEEAKGQLDEAQTALESLRTQKISLESDLESKRAALEKLTAERARKNAQLDELTTRLEADTKRLDSFAPVLEQAQTSMRALEARLRDLSTASQKAMQEERTSQEAVQEALSQLADLEANQTSLRERQNSKQTETARLKAQLEVLEQAESSMAGYADGARLLLEAARQNNLEGTEGAFSNSLEVPADLEVAISAALGDYADAILLHTGQSADQALTILETSDSGRASLLPMDWLTPAAPLKAPAHPDLVGVAANLVKAPAALRPAVDLLLGQVIVVRNRKSARILLAGAPQNTRAVTLQGEIFHASGQVQAGKPAHTAMLSRPRQRRELQSQAGVLEKELTDLEQEMQTLLGRIEAARGTIAANKDLAREKHAQVELARTEEQQVQIQLDKAKRELEWQKNQHETLQTGITTAEVEKTKAAGELAQSGAQLAELNQAIHAQNTALASLAMDEPQSQAAFWSTRLAVSERAADDANKRLTERRQAKNLLEQQNEALTRRLAELDATMVTLESEKETLRRQEGELNTRLEELRQSIEPAEKELESAEAAETEIQKTEAENQQALAKVERQYNQVQLDLSRKQESLDMLRQKIEDDFGLVAFEYQTDVSGPVPLPFEGMVEQLNVLTELPVDLEENLTHQRALLRRMGPVNPEARQEFEAVKQRYEFMTTQLDDLHKAETDLHQVIAELDELTKISFHKTFTAVAEEFHDIFHRLFGGGSARLVLTDPENLTETGIDIEARLPGRREQGLSLLSGGERSLTAIALVFALLKVSPTPVCVMDEVDAMLDEANVGRFRDLLLDLSRATQFVIVTHNRNTVQAADVIYGVTMGRDSTSQVISLKLDELSDEYLK